jgi:acyl carrier protein
MDQGLQAQVIQSAAKAFAIPMDQLNEHANSRNVEGWDSMAHLQFITLLEDKFRMRFSTADIMVMNSIQTAMEMVKKYQ